MFLAVHLGSQPSAPVCAGRLPGKDEAASSFCAVLFCSSSPTQLCLPFLAAVKAWGFSDDLVLATLQRGVVASPCGVFYRFS